MGKITVSTSSSPLFILEKLIVLWLYDYLLAKCEITPFSRMCYLTHFSIWVDLSKPLGSVIGRLSHAPISMKQLFPAYSLQFPISEWSHNTFNFFFLSYHVPRKLDIWCDYWRWQNVLGFCFYYCVQQGMNLALLSSSQPPAFVSRQAMGISNDKPISLYNHNILPSKISEKIISQLEIVSRQVMYMTEPCLQTALNNGEHFSK